MYYIKRRTPPLSGWLYYMNSKLKRVVFSTLIFCILNIFIVHAEDEIKLYKNLSDGYMLNLPSDMVFDSSYAPIFTKGQSDSIYINISKEVSPYKDIDWYIDYYLNRFILSEAYQQSNNIIFKSKENKAYNGNNMQIINVVLNGLDNEKFDAYTYVTIKTNSLVFYRIMFKYKSTDETANLKIENALSSFSYFKPTQNAKFSLDFKPNIPTSWSEETLNLYNEIINSDKLNWGIYSSDIYNTGINESIPSLEQTLDYKFNYILAYIHFGTDFPTEFMQQNYENGRIVELTYQITDSNNENLYGYTPNLDIYRGLKDDEIRKFAKAAKEFNHPFLFRLTNEMNTDWTSYSGVVNLSDPEIYIDNWRRFYRIFEEEGVNNAIWIFNPNDGNFPPCKWNNFIAYYPGNDFVQMIGITGYNTGTYYNDLTGEVWREFNQIYTKIQNDYLPLFSEFPWIITEFASSSIGGDKAKWINQMFENIDNYKNIKIAVWFNYADYDYREQSKGQVSRPYWLDETPETTEAFKKGLKKYKR